MHHFSEILFFYLEFFTLFDINLKCFRISTYSTYWYTTYFDESCAKWVEMYVFSIIVCINVTIDSKKNNNFEA